MEWLKLYSEWAFDPKVQSMTENFQRRHAMLLCFHKAGMVPGLSEAELAHGMRISLKELAETKTVFVAKGFIDETWRLLKWDKRQAGMSESRERVARHRKRYSNATETLLNGESEVTVTRARTLCSSLISSPSEGVEGEPPPTEPGPEFTALGELAISVSTDLSMGRWVSDMARLGFSVAMIRYSIEQGVAAGNFGHKWLLGILRSVEANGIPAPPKGKTAAGVMPSQYVDPEIEAKNKRVAARVAANEAKRKARNA